MKKQEKQLSIRFPSELLALIQTQATQQKRSVNAQVIWMLQDYLALQKGEQEKGGKKSL